LGNQNEVFIAVDPHDPQRVFAISRTEPFANGVFAAHSSDGGETWIPSKIAVDGGSIPAGVGDPWAVFEDHGKLFITYLADPAFDPNGKRPTIVAMSGDGGATFSLVEALGPRIFTDRSSIATGPAGTFASGSLWVTYNDQTAHRIVARGAALDAGGNPIADFCGPSTGVFCVEETVATDIAFVGEVLPAHITVGPDGQVLVSYMRWDGNQSGTTRIYVTLDADGLGSSMFTDPSPGDSGPDFTTNVGASNLLPANPRRISPLANLAWDRSAGAHRGRVHLVSTSEEPDGSKDTDIVLLYSDDNGAHWSAPKQVNDDPHLPSGVRSQFFPMVAVDQTTGDVAVAWHDARRDDGGADGIPNTETEVYAAVSRDGGGHFMPNVRVSGGPNAGASRAVSSETSYGDYLGLDFNGGVIHAAWADNSNGVGDNPDGGQTPPLMDAYTARIVFGPDSDGDEIADAVDNCVSLPNAPPLSCDTDKDGYGNACDGDFDQSFAVNATDFSARFLPDFKVGTDAAPIDGTDMNCSGTVDATDFSSYFLPQFLAPPGTAPGPSGLSCAGAVPCPPFPASP
jgi:hypothetical protein